MPTFTYRARDGRGMSVKGSVTAVSKAAAYDQLVADAIYTTQLSESAGGKDARVMKRGAANSPGPCPSRPRSRRC